MLHTDNIFPPLFMSSQNQLDLALFVSATGSSREVAMRSSTNVIENKEQTSNAQPL